MNEWDRRIGEHPLWYARFESYRLLGPGRTISAAFRVATGKDISHRAGASWWQHFRADEWQRRAEAWDITERDRLRAADEERRRAAREERLRLLGESRKQVWAALSSANLAELSQDDARQMLGTLRIFLFETFKGERLEMGEPTEIVADVDIVQFRADELAAAEEDVQKWREERKKQNG